MTQETTEKENKISAEVLSLFRYRLKETEDETIVYFSLPGLTENDVSVAVENYQIVITDKNDQLRSVFDFTDDDDYEKTTADITNGLLTIVVPKVSARLKEFSAKLI